MYEVVDLELSITMKHRTRYKKVFRGGYGGYCKDLDGHLWEVAYNPLYSVEPRDGEQRK